MSIQSIEQHVKSEVESAENKLRAWFAKTFQAIKAASPAASHKAIDNVIVNNPPPESHVPAPLPVLIAPLTVIPGEEGANEQPTFNGAPPVEAKSQSTDDVTEQQEPAQKAAQVEEASTQSRPSETVAKVE